MIAKIFFFQVLCTNVSKQVGRGPPSWVLEGLKNKANQNIFSALNWAAVQQMLRTNALNVNQSYIISFS